MAKGWITIHRQIQDHWIWQDPEKLRAWLDLILMANHEKAEVGLREGMVIVNRGQLITSIGKLAERWKWSKDRVRRFLKVLSDTNMIVRKSDTHKTTITIVNYDKFQDKPTTNKTTNKTSSKTSSKTSGKTRTTMNNNDKQINKEAESLLEEAPASEEDDDENYVQDPSTMWCTDEEWEAGEVIS